MIFEPSNHGSVTGYSEHKHMYQNVGHYTLIGFQSTKELLSLIQTKTSDLVSLSHFPFLFGNHINNSKAQVLLSAHGTLERGQFNLGNYIFCFVMFAIFCLF